MSSNEELYYQVVETQMLLGKQASSMLLSIASNKWIKEKAVAIDFYGHKYKMTIEKDNGDE